MNTLLHTLLNLWPVAVVVVAFALLIALMVAVADKVAAYFEPEE